MRPSRWAAGTTGDEVVRYSLLGEGKRLRPTLVFATHEALNGSSSPGVAELGYLLDRRWQECSHAVGIDAVGHARVDGQPIAAHHYYGVHAVGTAERLHHVADGRHTRGQRRFPPSRSQAATMG